MFYNKITFLFVFAVSMSIYGMQDEPVLFKSTDIVADNIDELVIKGIDHIKDNGEYFSAQAGNGQQSYDVNYTLKNPNNRVHTLRAPQSIKYFARELLAYFKGSLKVNEGLAQASKVWNELQNEEGEIASNYGYYVFHQKTQEEKTQYDWVIDVLSKNLDSRKAFININQVNHKKIKSKDFPCTLGMQFFVKKNYLCCSVSSRSTDIYTGLPYDMGFFSFVHELVYRQLKQSFNEKTNDLKLGYVTMKTNFTQIYDKTRTNTIKLWEKNKNLNFNYTTDMPEIYSANETLQDIYNGTFNSPVMKWIEKNAKFEK